jgi:hypothetical protein
MTNYRPLMRIPIRLNPVAWPVKPAILGQSWDAAEEGWSLPRAISIFAFR